MVTTNGTSDALVFESTRPFFEDAQRCRPRPLRCRDRHHAGREGAAKTHVPTARQVLSGPRLTAVPRGSPSRHGADLARVHAVTPRDVGEELAIGGRAQRDEQRGEARVVDQGVPYAELVRFVVHRNE